MKTERYGTVYFIGAGPGDPELLTLKAANILSKAEVIITDRLVSEDIIKCYANPAAIIIFVGKQGNNNASTSQFEINDLLIRFSSIYNNVIRLKGGDVSLYSNILDELLTLKEYNITYEIIPGITAASGASAYTGVPLTARGLATGVRVLTYYKDSAVSSEAWKNLALFEDTLVFYMSGNALQQLVLQLLRHGAHEEIPFLVIEQATTPHQFVHEFTLGTFRALVTPPTFISPSLVIMGKVTALYKQFAWLQNSNQRSPYFKTLINDPQLITLINNIQDLSHVSRA